MQVQEEDQDEERLLEQRRPSLPSPKSTTINDYGGTTVTIPAKTLRSRLLINWHRSCARPDTHLLSGLCYNLLTRKNGWKSVIILSGCWLIVCVGGVITGVALVSERYTTGGDERDHQT